MPELKLCERVRTMKPSATLGMAAAARALAESGVNVIALSAGEPDFDTPKIIAEVGKASIDAGKTHYAPVRGTKNIIMAMQEKFARDQGVKYSADELMCTVGGKSAILMALRAILEEGDEVIVFAPYWVSYIEQIRLCGGKAIVIKCLAENDFMPSEAELRYAISPKTKAIILNSPNNPSGGVINKEQLNALARVLEGSGIWLISDEIYEKLLYDGAVHYSPSAVSADMRERTVVISGVSKGYAMTGWRVGVVAGNARIISAMGNLQGQETTCLPEFIQDAAAFALREGPEVKASIWQMLEAYEERRRLALAGFSSIPGIEVFKSKGAFYIWADFNAYMTKTIAGAAVKDDMDLAYRMLNEAHVASVPGTPFGASGFLRFSIASSLSDIENAVARITAWLKNK